MNRTLFLILFLALSPYQAHCYPVFSSMIKGSGNTIFVALKDETGKRPSPNISTINKETLEIKSLDLSEEIRGRDVIALYYHRLKNVLLVLSQWTIEDGDKPMLHTYDIKKKRWKKLGQFECPSFDFFSIDNQKAELTCADGNKSSIAIPKLKLSNKLTVNLPQDKVVVNTQSSIRFKGFPYFWKQIHIIKNGNITALKSLHFYEKKK